MKNLKSITLAAVVSLAFAGSALADEFVKGKVKKVNEKNGKVTVIHEEIPSLEMPAMTMVFRTAEDQMAEKLEPGQEIEFVAERVDGKLTITKIKE